MPLPSASLAFTTWVYPVSETAIVDDVESHLLAQTPYRLDA
jgi:hypothetical protein